MSLKIKKLRPDAIIPTRSYESAAGIDLYLPLHDMRRKLPGHAEGVLKLGIAVEIPEGYYLKIEARSSLAKRGYIAMAGVIDADYRGELMLMYYNCKATEIDIMGGDRVAQAVLLPVSGYGIVEVSELSDTARGEGGFGSSGR